MTAIPRRSTQALIPFVSAALLLSLGAASRAQSVDKPPPEFEGAIGLLASNGPAFMGADERKTKVLPGIYLRYGRLSITNASGFITRGNEEVIRGLGIELGRSEHLKASLGLRYDAGRRESTSGGLQGLGTVKSTVRTRLALRYHLDPHWQVNASWSVDTFGRGGGNFGEFSVQRDQRWSPSTTWAFGAGTSLAGDRYLQTWFGVTPEQSAKSGYAIYEPRSGLRDVVLFANTRSQIAPRWVLLGGASLTRLVGPAADSPIVRKPTSFSINGGLAWSF